MNIYLVQYFNQFMINNDMSKVYSLYLGIGKELILALVHAKLIVSEDILLYPKIELRPEYGQQYGENQGLFDHCIFVFRSASSHDDIKELLIGFEYVEINHQLIRLLDIDLYSVQQGYEKKISFVQETRQSLKSLVQKSEHKSSASIYEMKKKIFALMNKDAGAKGRSNSASCTSCYRSILEDTFHQELIAVTNIKNTPSLTNQVVKLDVECIDKRYRVYIKTFYDYPISNKAIRLEPAYKRIRRYIRGYDAFSSLLRDWNGLQVAELMCYNCEKRYIIEKDMEYPYGIFPMAPNQGIDLELLDCLAESLAHIHQNTCGRLADYMYDLNWDDEFEYAAEIVNFRINLVSEYLQDVPHERKTTRYLVQQYRLLCQQSINLIRSGGGVVCHGDLALKNIIRIAPRHFCMTDLEHFCIHDPAFDVGFFAGHILADASDTYLQNKKRANEFIQRYLDLLSGSIPSEGLFSRIHQYAHLIYWYRKASSKDRAIQIEPL